MLATQSHSGSVSSPSGFSLNLVGGWRINQPYCKGGLAIDFATMRCWTAGHAANGPTTIFGYQLPASGTGTNIAIWPSVGPSWNYGVPFTFSGNGSPYYTGLHWEADKLWISPREFYTASGSYPTTIVKKFSLSGNVATLVDTLTFAGRPMQKFGGGFIKGGASLLLGCGGYESGQGSASGPCWMDLSGVVQNEFPDFSANASLREKRDSNYSTASSNPDAWITGPLPNPVWCAGRIWGGGLVINGQTCFFVNLGTGTLVYTNQTETFGTTSQRYLYKYASGSHFGTWSDFPYANVLGSDIANGLVYVLLGKVWGDACPAIAVFQVGAG